MRYPSDKTCPSFYYGVSPRVSSSAPNFSQGALTDGPETTHPRFDPVSDNIQEEQLGFYRPDTRTSVMHTPSANARLPRAVDALLSCHELTSTSVLPLPGALLAVSSFSALRPYASIDDGLDPRVSLPKVPCGQAGSFVAKDS